MQMDMQWQAAVNTCMQYPTTSLGNDVTLMVTALSIGFASALEHTAIAIWNVM